MHLINKTIDVDTGEYYVSTEPVILRSIALGSCVAFLVYDRTRKIGGLAHIMLPGKAPTTNKTTKYAENSIDILLETVQHLGASINDLEIFVVGGANILQDGDIPDKIIDSVLGYIVKLNLEIKYMRVGGIQRRSVLLDVTSGQVFFTEGNNTTKILLQKNERI